MSSRFKKGPNKFLIMIAFFLFPGKLSWRRQEKKIQAMNSISSLSNNLLVFRKKIGFQDKKAKTKREEVMEAETRTERAMFKISVYR